MLDLSNFYRRKVWYPYSNHLAQVQVKDISCFRFKALGLFREDCFAAIESTYCPGDSNDQFITISYDEKLDYNDSLLNAISLDGRNAIYISIPSISTLEKIVFRRIFKSTLHFTCVNATRNLPLKSWIILRPLLNRLDDAAPHPRWEGRKIWDIEAHKRYQVKSIQCPYVFYAICEAITATNIEIIIFSLSTD